MFPFAQEYTTWEALKETGRMHKHAASVMKAVDVAVQGLGDDTTTAPATALALKALGGRHYKYGVKPMYFEVSVDLRCKIFGQTVKT